MTPYFLKWGGFFPPYFKYGVFVICGFELCISAISMAVGQKYYELCSILFPISMRIFDDTVQKRIPNFKWTAEERSVLRMVVISSFFYNIMLRKLKLTYFLGFTSNHMN